MSGFHLKNLCEMMNWKDWMLIRCYY